MANAIDNTNLINLDRGYVPVGFTPSVSYVYDAAAKTVVFMDASTIPAGDALSKVQVRVIDMDGNEVRDAITTTGAGGAKTLNVASLNSAKPFNLAVTVLTTGHIAADGGAYQIGAAGVLSYWDTQKNA